jgi:hypothetical protein
LGKVYVAKIDFTVGRNHGRSVSSSAVTSRIVFKVSGGNSLSAVENVTGDTSATLDLTSLMLHPLKIFVGRLTADEENLFFIINE